MPGRAGVGARMARWSDGPFVGRDDIVDELLGAADAAARGAGSIAVLTGEAGIGKTTVARVLAQRVREQLAVSWGTCVTDQSAPPFWPWRELVAVEPSDTGPTDEAVGAPRFERLTGLRDQLLHDVRRRPRLHVIEDLQWADVASVLLLAHVGATIVDAPFLVVATVRTGEQLSAQLDDAIQDVSRMAHV